MDWVAFYGSEQGGTWMYSYTLSGKERNHGLGCLLWFRAGRNMDVQLHTIRERKESWIGLPSMVQSREEHGCTVTHYQGKKGIMDWVAFYGSEQGGTWMYSYTLSG